MIINRVVYYVGEENILARAHHISGHTQNKYQSINQNDFNFSIRRPLEI